MTNNNLFKELFESISVPLIVTDTQGKIRFVNHYTELLLNVAHNTLTDNHFCSLFSSYPHTSTPTENHEILFQEIVNASKHNKEFVATQTTGEKIYVELSCIPCHTSAGKLLLWSALSSSNEKKLAYDLNERVKEQMAILGVIQTLFKRSDIQHAFSDCLAHIKNGWQFPEVTQVMISLSTNDTFVTPNYDASSTLKQSASIIGISECYGVIEVSYAQPVPLYKGATFLYEEEKLIDTLAKLFGLYLDQWHAINSLKNSEGMLKKITSMVPANTYQFEIDENGRTAILFVNKGIEEINHEYQLKDLEDHPEKLREILHEDDKERFNTTMMEAHKAPGFLSIQYRMVVNSHTRWRWLRATAEKTPDGRVLWYGASQDITPILNYVGTLEQILFDISHVIRRPLSSILGLTQLIKDLHMTEENIKSISEKMIIVAQEMNQYIKCLNEAYNEKKLMSEANKFSFSFIDKREELFRVKSLEYRV